MQKNKLFTLFGMSMLLVTSAFSLASAPKTSIVEEAKIKYAQDDETYIDVNSIDEYLGRCFSITSSTKTNSTINYRCSFYRYGGDNSYVFGYYGGDTITPLTVQYDVVNTSGDTVSRETEIANPSMINPYFGVGEALSIFNLDFDINLELYTGESIATDSIRFVNIFECSRSSGSLVPSYENNYYFGIDVRGVETYDLNDFVEIELKELVSYGSYTSINFDFNVHVVEMYKVIKESVYDRNYDPAANYVRSLLSSIYNVYVGVTFDDGTYIQERLVGTERIVVTEGSNSINFLINKIDANKVKSVDIRNLSFQIALSSLTTKRPVVSSATLELRFGQINFDDIDANVKNVILEIVIETLVFAVAFAGVALGLYFYRKNKYKNDEFKRVDLKKYLKMTGISLIGVGSLYYFLVFVIYRMTAMNNSTVVYNPLDVLIVIFMISSILMVGYFAKYFFKLYKDNKAKKKNTKLKISDSEKKDDGTN